MLHTEILNKDQTELLPLLKEFKREYYLVGGTAIALYLGHRRSIDFDLFKFSNINPNRNLKKIHDLGFKTIVTRNVKEQLNLIVNGVKITFFQYPFEIKAVTKFDSYIKIPSLLDLAAMKAYALGRRSKWKDYVDLYFLLNESFSLEEIIKRSEELFGDFFSEKLFRAQLSYFKDIDYTEEVEFLQKAPNSKDLKEFLIMKSTDI